MVIICNVNKTEVICFHSDTPQLELTSFTLGDKTIQVMGNSKVLGVILDKNLEKVDADSREEIILMLLLGNDAASADALAALVS